MMTICHTFCQLFHAVSSAIDRCQQSICKKNGNKFALLDTYLYLCTIYLYIL